MPRNDKDDPQRPYIGYRSAGRRPESQQDRTAAANAPLAAMRGFASGVLGAPGDLEALVRMLPGLSSETVLPTSEDIERRLPLRSVSETPTGRAVTSASQLGGGFYMGPGSPLRAAGALPGAVRRAGAEFASAAGQSGPHVIKPKGGNWLSGSIENAIAPLKNPYVDKYEAELQRWGSPEKAREWVADPGDHARAANRWVETKLAKYIKNEMGTPTDPLRVQADEFAVKKAQMLEQKDAQIAKALDDMERARAERGFTPEMMTQSQARIRELRRERALIDAQQGLHFQPENIFLPSSTAALRQQEGFPRHGLAQSRVGTDWETLADTSITPDTAANVLRMEGYPASDTALLANPWLRKVPPETKFYEVRPTLAPDVGFGHLVDELKNALDPASGLPERLRLSTEDIDKLTVPRAAKLVDDINAWRAQQTAEANAARASNVATVLHKDYPEAGLKWVELKVPEPSMQGLKSEYLPEVDMWRIVNEQDHVASSGATEREALGLLNRKERESALADALKYEGEMLQHCVGGYCPDVVAGRSRIFSLRDTEGRPHATVEVKPGGDDPLAEVFRQLPREEQLALRERALGAEAAPMDNFLIGREADANRALVREQMLRERPELAELKAPERIVQIKGKQNRAPAPEVQPYVQDFVRSGQWSDVGDLKNTGLYDVKRPDELGMFMPEAEDLRDIGPRAPVLKRALEAGRFGEQRYVDRETWEKALREQLLEEGSLPKPEGFAEGGSVKASPQNPLLGAAARGLRSLQQLASQYQVLPQVPLLGGTSVDELLSLPGAASLMEDVSYHGPRALIRGGNVATGGIGTFRPDPRIIDVADVASTAAPVGALAGRGAMALGRAGERLAERAVPEIMSRGGTGAQLLEALSHGTTSNVIKPKGGNWLAGHTDYALQPLRSSNQPVLSGEIVNQAAGRDLFSEYRKAYDQDPTVGLHEWTRKNYPEIYAQIQGPEAAAADRFVNTKLDKYIRNEMGTPEDPVRALAERGVLHFEPQNVFLPSDVAYARTAAGYPRHGMGKSQLATDWEVLSDSAINAATANDYLKFMGDAEYAKTIEKNPWLKKVPPETKVYGTAEAETLVDDLGFEHLIDELKNAMDPASDLPRQLRFDPKDVDKITVPQAVERVAEINAWRAKQAAEAEKAGMMANLQATPRMADDSLQLSFVDKPGGAWVDIPETVDDKGIKLCTSIGKAGGWCTQDKWAAHSYGSGVNRLTALVDAEGRPHAQAKITENNWPVSGEGFTRLDPQTKAQYGQYVREWRQRNPDVEELTDADVIQALKEAGVQGPAPDITEFKPVGNSFRSERAQEYAKRDPEYFRKVENSVLKFLNSGDWGKVADLHHYGIVDLQRDPVMLLSYLRDITKQDSRGAQALFNQAIDRNPNAPRFMTARQLRDFLTQPEGFAGGGLVKGAVKGIGEMVEKYLAKEAPQIAAEAAPKEQKMLQGFYRGYAGENVPAKTTFGTETYFVSPQRKVADYYAQRRAAEMNAEPHAEMILADPFATRNNPYGLSIPIDKYNRDFLVTRARRIDPDEVKERTPLYAEGGAVDASPADAYDPAEIDTIVSRVKEELHG